MRAAPIQLSWAGYVGTVGLDTYDGLIADPVEIPPEHDASYIERPIRLPDCYVCYHPPAKAPEVPPLPSLSGGRFTFGCFNRPAKLNSELGKAWARILEQVPDSRILMVYGGLGETSTRDAVYNVLGQGGMPRERVELVGETEQDKLLVAYGEVDVAQGLVGAGGAGRPDLGDAAAGDGGVGAEIRGQGRPPCRAARPPARCGAPPDGC
mgnify:CR=1 FL=1